METFSGRASYRKPALGNRCVTVIWTKGFSLLRSELFEVWGWSFLIEVHPAHLAPSPEHQRLERMKKVMTANAFDLLHTRVPVGQTWFVPGLILGHQCLVVSTQLRGVTTPEVLISM